MSLFVSNSTLQHYVFNYREPVNGISSHVDIRSGGQQEIGHGWNNAQTQLVIAQLERYGARDAAESYGKMESFMGLLYRDNAPVSSDEIKLGHDALVDTLERRSATEATNAALGFDRAINQGSRGNRIARETEVSVEQLIGRHEPRTGKEVAFNITVDPSGRSDVKLPGR